MKSAPRVSSQRKPIARASVVRHQKRRWSKSVDEWDHHGVAGLEVVIEAVVEAAKESGSVEVVVDVGAGTGAITIPVAAHAGKVVAVDVSETMLDRLVERAAAEQVANIEVRPGAIEHLTLAPSSVDLVVSNYALHHLLDRDKSLFVEQAATWLRPGGRLVIGDMMIGRGTNAEDRSIMAGKVKIMLGRGPGGWWRIAKNAWRLLLRVSERPIPLDTWEDLLRRHGFVAVTGRRVLAEAGLVTGRRPPAAAATGRAQDGSTASPADDHDGKNDAKPGVQPPQAAAMPLTSPTVTPVPGTEPL